MKTLLVLSLIVFAVVETLQGADARRWSGLKERRLGNTSNNGKGNNAGRAITGTETPATATTSSSPAASTTSSTTMTRSSPAGSSADATTGSMSSKGGDNGDDDEFWGQPSSGQTHHLHDYNQPQGRA